LKNYYAEKRSSVTGADRDKLSSSPPGGAAAAGRAHTILKKSLDHGGGGDDREPAAAFSHSVSLPNRHAKFRDVVEIVEFAERDKVLSTYLLEF